MLNEGLIIKKLDSGITAYFINKKGYYMKHALVGVNFGSIYNKFKIGGKFYEQPFGVAHFLEHKLFEEKNINIMNEFVKLGADANAYTNNTNTAYYFNTGEEFDKPFELLLKMVSNLYLTDESVNNEKQIIMQEINMYADYPAWNAYLNMMVGMYYNESFSKNIAGDLADIENITKESLQAAYDAFYYPENMCIICIGEIDIDKTIAQINSNITGTNKKIEFIFDEEKPNTKNYFSEKKRPIENTIFTAGFKDNDINGDILKNTVASKFLIDIMFGESSKFYEDMYTLGLIDNSFNGDYNNFKFFAANVLAGVSKGPKELFKHITEQVNLTKQNGISEKRFDQIKKKQIGLFIRGFNSIDNISSLTLDLFSKGYDFMQFFDAYKNMELEYLTKRLFDSYTSNNYVLSVISPS
ncbi:MAG: insulinase family protein [Clostridiales bacterium]|jgi:predicted Zn-dependent peptidase|nr:insulinase family protein [Clostridiales bacterium]